MKHEIRLDGDHHSGNQDRGEEAFPQADPDPEDAPGEEHGPEGLGEDEGEGVAQLHEGQAGKLKVHPTACKDRAKTTFNVVFYTGLQL